MIWTAMSEGWERARGWRATGRCELPQTPVVQASARTAQARDGRVSGAIAVGERVALLNYRSLEERGGRGEVAERRRREEVLNVDRRGWLLLVEEGLAALSCSPVLSC